MSIGAGGGGGGVKASGSVGKGLAPCETRYIHQKV